MDVEFENAADTHRKLHGCVIQYKEDFYSCRVDEGGATQYHVRIYKIPNGRAITVDTRDPEFEARFMPLGYMNHKNGVTWLQRNPVRRIVLGSNDNTIEHRSLDGDFAQTRTIQCSEYVDVCKNKYPTWAEALNVLRSTQLSGIAVSRDFAMGWADRPYNLRLYWKNNPVGIIQWNDKLPPADQVVTLYKTPFRSFIMQLIRELKITHDDSR